MRGFSLIKENILQYLDYKGISKYEFYKLTGVSNGVLSQKNGMSEENTLRFLSYFNDINPTWLLTGKGPMLLSEQERVDMRVHQPTSGIETQDKDKGNKGSNKNSGKKDVVSLFDYELVQRQLEAVQEQLAQAIEERGVLKYQLGELKALLHEAQETIERLKGEGRS